MAQPNGFWTLIRRAVVKVVQPQPPVGKCWCWDCSLNHWQTLEIDATAAISHAERHRDGPKDMRYLSMTMRQESRSDNVADRSADERRGN